MFEQNGLNVAGTHEPPLVHWKTWAAAVSDAENRPGAGFGYGERKARPLLAFRTAAALPPVKDATCPRGLRGCLRRLKSDRPQGSTLGCRGGPYGSRNRTGRKRAGSWTLVECPAPARMQCRE